MVEVVVGEDEDFFCPEFCWMGASQLVMVSTLITPEEFRDDCRHFPAVRGDSRRPEHPDHRS